MDGHTILYRAADTANPAIWGRYVEAQAFEDAEVPAKLSEGWVYHPQDIPEDARKSAPKASKKAAEQ